MSSGCWPRQRARHSVARIGAPLLVLSIMKLIGSVTSPYVRKVRVVMLEKRLDYTLMTEDVWAADTGIKAANPLGKIPCLVLDGGEAMFDSRVIVEYLDGLSPVGRLIPQSGRERAEVKTWEALADGIMDASILARLEAGWAGRADGERSQAWIDRQLGKVESAIEAIAQGLAEKPFCCGKTFSLADIAVVSALGYLDFRFPSLGWRDRSPRLAAWQSALATRSSFAATNHS